MLLTLLALLVPRTALAWETSLNGTVLTGVNEARAIAVDAGNNAVAVGVTENFNPLFPGDPAKASKDFTVAKLSAADGTELWRAEINDPEDRNSQGFGVVVHPDGGVIAAGMVRFSLTSGRFTVVKLAASSGAELWRAEIDGDAGSDDQALAVAIDSAGDVLAGGLVVSAAGGDDLLVMKINGSSGNITWTRQIDTASGLDSAFALIADAADDVVVAAKLDDDFGVVKLSGLTGSLVWSSRIDNQPGSSGEARAIRLNSAGEVVVSGMIDEDFAVVKLAAVDGSVLWSYTRDGTKGNIDSAFGVDIDAADDVFAAGTIVNVGTTDDFTVVKLSGATGSETWRREIDGSATNTDQAKGITLDASGDVIASGFIKDPVSLDFAILKFSGASGAELWRRVITGAPGVRDEASAVDIDSEGNVLAGGFIDNTGTSPGLTVVKVSGATGGDVTCGDAVVSAGESCEDGNTLDGDCCSSTCQLMPATTECRAAAGACDVAEFCTGTSATCPVDTMSTAPCRAAAGECDVAEFCSGASATCPVDTKSTAQCRAAADVCDLAEVCDGIGDTCPADILAAPTTECRPAAGGCDVAELCTGADVGCPADGFAAVGTTCGAAATECSAQDTCDGVGSCQSNDISQGTVCADEGNDCTADICSGLGTCIHPALAAGALCGDPAATECSAADSCDGAGSCLANNIASGTACADEGNDCTDDICDGAGACSHPPTAALTACGDPSDTQCSNPDSCDGVGACDARDEISGFNCGDAGSECVVQDTCNGAGSCTDNGFVAALTACGDPSDTQCSNPDSCDGAGSCDARDEVAGFSCGDAGSECVVQDTCNGAGSCTDNGFVAALTACGSVTDTECTNPDTCDGVGFCDPRDEVAGFSCGDAGTECTVQDTCNGTGTCNDNGFVAALTACGSAADTECSNPDSCDGVGSCDARDEVAGFSCGDAGSECVVQDTCDGAGSCTDNGFVAALTACGSVTDTECTNPDTCDGVGFCDPRDEVAGFSCGDAGTECTVQDTCNGTGTCNDNGFVAALTACGSAADTECSNPDSCDGVGSCDARDEVAGFSCGDAGSECVVQDTCNGAGSCTDNGFVAALTACGSVTDTECTNPDTCDGVGFCDSRDEVAGFSCGDAGTECTVQDTCNGTGTCNDNGFVAALTACGSALDTQCTNPDSCDGVGFCDPRDEAAGLSCGDAGTECVVQDTCNGAGSCTDNGFVTDGSTCDDGNVCTTVDACIAGACAGGSPLDCNDGNVCTDDSCIPTSGCLSINNTAACDDASACTVVDTCNGGICVGQPPLECNDGNPCTQDSCDDLSGCINAQEPAALCLPGNSMQLTISDSSNDARDQIGWKWGRGAATSQVDFGDPLMSTSYTLCVYDSAASVSSLAAWARVDPNSAWRDKSPRGWAYKDKSAAFDGIDKIKLKPGAAGRSRAQLRARGVGTPTPLPVAVDRLFALDPSVTVQLINSEGVCWTSEFSAADVRKNSQKKFKAKFKQ